MAFFGNEVQKYLMLSDFSKTVSYYVALHSKPKALFPSLTKYNTVATNITWHDSYYFFNIFGMYYLYN